MDVSDGLRVYLITHNFVNQEQRIYDFIFFQTYTIMQIYANEILLFCWIDSHDLQNLETKYFTIISTFFNSQASYCPKKITKKNITPSI